MCRLLKRPEPIRGGKKGRGRRETHPGLKLLQDLVYNHFTLSQKTISLFGSICLKNISLCAFKILHDFCEHPYILVDIGTQNKALFWVGPSL